MTLSDSSPERGLTHSLTDASSESGQGVIRLGGWEYCRVQSGSSLREAFTDFFYPDRQETEQLAITGDQMLYSAMDQALARLGAQGWELVSVAGGRYLLKRPVGTAQRHAAPRAPVSPAPAAGPQPPARGPRGSPGRLPPPPDASAAACGAPSKAAPDR